MDKVRLGLVIGICILFAALAGIMLSAYCAHFAVISEVVEYFIMFIFVCFAVLAAAGTFNLVGIMNARRLHDRMYATVIMSGEVVAVQQDDGSYEHLSAEHWKAKVPAMLALGEKAESTVDYTEDVLTMYDMGMHPTDIIRNSKIPREQVQEILGKHRR